MVGQEKYGPVPRFSQAVSVRIHPRARVIALSFVDAVASAFGPPEVDFKGHRGEERAFIRDLSPMPIFRGKEEPDWVALPRSVQGGDVIVTEEPVFVANRGWDSTPLKLAEALEIDPTRVQVLPRMPGEASGHLDVYLLALPRDRVVIPEIPEAALAAIGYAHEVAVGRLVQTFLDERAEALAAQGLLVDRLPMMPPIHLKAARDRPEGWAGVAVSPTNTPLLHIGDKKIAFIPAYPSAGFGEAYRAQAEANMATWSAYFEQLGYSTQLVDATGVVDAGGNLTRVYVAEPL